MHNLCKITAQTTKMATILLLNGPNLNLLGSREPDVYGELSLPEIEAHLAQIAKDTGHKLVCFQSSSEGQLIERIHKAQIEHIDYILFNPAAYTHTSIALRDALLAVDIPFIEVHLSNTYTREEFRHHSFFSDIAQGVIVGFGPAGYEVALNAVIKQLN